MLKFFFVLLLITQSVLAARLTIDQRRQKILSIVDEELAEVSRLAKQQNYKSPDTLFRMAELNLEKARLYRELENEQYLAIPVNERVRVNKNDYFKRSTSFFGAANKAARAVVKRFPRYSNIGDVYYILAYNYKELGKDKIAQKYFSLAAGKSRDPKVAIKSKLALADYYYNERKYREAIPLYEATISRSDEKWWTKDAFNLAWSYYRVRNYNKAISLMREVHKKSGGKYVDMRSQVERDIGIFFVDANRINEAISFYDSLSMNYTEQFIRIANALVSQGRFKQAEKLLSKVKRMEKNQEKRVEILLSELVLFEKYNKEKEHLAVANELVALHLKSPLPKHQFDRLNFQVSKQAAELQKASTSDIYKSVPKTRRKKANQAIAYFGLAAQLNPNEKAEKIFYQGETAYAVGSFGKALRIYVSAFDSAKAQNDKKILGQSLEGMLSSLGQKSLSRKFADKYYIPVYSRYISVDSRSERASSIFVKLFNAQFDAGDISGAEKTLTDFAASFPKDYKTQEGMLAKVMENYRKKKDYNQVKSYVNRINEGEFKVSRKYADALRSLMTKIQIEGVQQSLEKGDKGIALRGYHQIYESPESTPKAKINASYNLAALYYDLGDTNQSYQWSVTALKDMDVKDVTKFADSFLSIAAGMFLRQQFAQSSDLSYRMLAKLCRQNSSNKVVAYKNAVFIALANNDLDKALEIKDFGKSCSIPDTTVSEVSFEVLKDLAKAKRWESYEKILGELERNSRNYPELIRPYEDLRVQLQSIGDAKGARAIVDKQNRFYQQSKTQKLDIPVEALDLIADRMLAAVQDKKARLDQITLAFPEATFNNAVKSKLQLLDQMTNEVNNIQKIGSGKGIVEAYKYVIDAYESFGNELKNFTPEGKAPEYVASFKKAMAEVHGPILMNAKKQRGEIRKLISKNKILSYSNYDVLYPDLQKSRRFFTEKDAVLMDRGGRR
ncbi:MAG: hypothetical protein ACLGHN_08695 [Bacteriovoracia bacterium]